MKIFVAFFIFLLLFPVVMHSAVVESLAMICTQLFLTTVIKDGVPFVFEMAKIVAQKYLTIKDVENGSKENIRITGKTNSNDIQSTKNEFLQVANVIKQTNKKMKASFKGVKTLMRDHHFQTHIQFPSASLVLHLEQFLSHPSNSTEDDLRLTCTNTLPNTILKNLEMTLKDDFLVHQSGNNLKKFEKLKNGIILMFKQLIFAQGICLQIRNFGATDAQHKFSLNIAENIEFYIKKQETEVSTKFHLNTVLSSTLSHENDINNTDFKNHNASLYENIGIQLCQKVKASSEIKNVDIFLTHDSLDFTVLSKNRYFEEVYNGWKFIAFYPKISHPTKQRSENIIDLDEEVDDEEELQRSKTVSKNQIIFECKNVGHCSLIGGSLGGMYCNGMGKHLHYAICGNIGVTFGHPITSITKLKEEELTEEEKAETEKWEKTKLQLTDYLNAQKLIVSKSASEKREIRKEKLVEKTVTKVLKELKEEKEEAKVATEAVVLTNGKDTNFSAIFVTTFVFTFYYSIF